jgi:dienelactone hydrolase
VLMFLLRPADIDLASGGIYRPCRAVLPSSNGRAGIIGTCSGGRHALLAASRAPRFDAVADLWGRGIAAKEGT